VGTLARRARRPCPRRQPHARDGGAGARQTSRLAETPANRPFDEQARAKRSPAPDRGARTARVMATRVRRARAARRSRTRPRAVTHRSRRGVANRKSPWLRGRAERGRGVAAAGATDMVTNRYGERNLNISYFPRSVRVRTMLAAQVALGAVLVTSGALLLAASISERLRPPTSGRRSRPSCGRSLARCPPMNGVLDKRSYVQGQLGCHRRQGRRGEPALAGHYVQAVGDVLDVNEPVVARRKGEAPPRRQHVHDAERQQPRAFLLPAWT